MYLFFENKKIKAVFDDEKEMKRTIVFYILKFHINNSIYKNITESKIKLRKKLCDLFAPDLFFMESFNNTWFIKNIEKNKINKEIKIINFNTRYTKIDIKGRDITKKDLGKNISNINVSVYY